MRNIFLNFVHRLFDSSVDLRVRVFNLLAMAGCIGSFLTGTISLLTGADAWIVIIVYAASMLSALLIVYANRTQKYQHCYIITIAVIFIGFFSYLFFGSGGYHGGSPLYFVFAIVFTVFMLEGKVTLFAALIEFAVYSALYIYAYLHPQNVVSYPDEFGYFINNLGDLFIVGIALGATMYAQVRLYRAEKRKVDEKMQCLNRQIAQKHIF